jgi:hypothetical protein
VLYSPSQDSPDRRAAVFDHEGNVVGAGSVEVRAEQIEFAEGNSVLAYGNGQEGQYLAYFEAEDKKLVERWRRGAPRRADYSSQLIASRDLAIIGFEESSEETRQSHLLGFDRQGKLKLNIPLVTEEGAYLYAQAFSDNRAFLGVGTDDSHLAGYRISGR